MFIEAASSCVPLYVLVLCFAIPFFSLSFVYLSSFPPFLSPFGILHPIFDLSFILFLLILLLLPLTIPITAPILVFSPILLSIAFFSFFLLFYHLHLPLFIFQFLLLLLRFLLPLRHSSSYSILLFPLSSPLPTSFYLRRPPPLLAYFPSSIFISPFHLFLPFFTRHVEGGSLAFCLLEQQPRKG